MERNLSLPFSSMRREDLYRKGKIVMSNIEQKKCAHPACRCTVTENKQYCSQRCEDAKGEVEISCDCAHAGCSLS